MADIFSSKRIEEMMQKASVGTEPDAGTIKATEPDYRVRLMQAFNWYNYEKDIKVSRSYLRAWVKAQKTYDLKKFDAVVDELTAPVYGWMARLLSHGAVLSDADLKNFQDKVAELMGQYREAKPVVVEEVTVDTPARKSIQEAMAEKQAEFIGEFFEGEFDNFVQNDCRPTSFDMYKTLQAQNAAKQYCSAIVSLCERRLAEFEAIDGDDFMEEAYSNFSTAQIRRTMSWLEKVKTDAQRFADFKRANRKPKAKKVKPASVQVAKMQYLKEAAIPAVKGEIVIKSVAPTSIVGAQQLWVYNVKNKKLGVYMATGAAGFTVKGTSLQGWDPDTSVQRTLRKPDIVVPGVLEAGKVQLRKVLSDLTTTETKLNGRINADTILVRVL